MTTVRITDPPSVEGATQTRTVGAAIRPDESLDGKTAEIELFVDATQNGTFREVDTTRQRIVGETSVQFTAFIGVTPPYDLRVRVAGDEATTITVSPRESSQTADALGGDFPEDRQEVVTSPSTDSDLPTDATEITPRIGPVEPITMEAEYQLPFDRDSNQTACGTTIQNQNGDFNWRVVFNGVVSLSEFRQLEQLRDTETVETRSATLGVRDVQFDQLNATRTDENKDGEINGRVEPLIEFQLQTKELQDDAGFLGGN